MKPFISLVVQSLVALLIAGGALATSLQAQSDDAITFRIPFPFAAGVQTVRPGTYQFSLVSSGVESSRLLLVKNVTTGARELFDVRPERQRAIEQHGRLVFTNSEEGSVLNEIHFPGADTFSEVVQRRSTGIEAKRSSAAGSISIAQR